MAHPHGVCTGAGEDVRIMLHKIILSLNKVWQINDLLSIQIATKIEDKESGYYR